ncbi:putative exosome complex exonuclease [Encephalitozoon cuniculi]|nr:putative exosome complex exonuclease [Encephalitozoon cuniculi]
MEVRTGMISKALSSCYLKTNKTSVVCSIHFEQKGETEPQVEVVFSEVVPLWTHSPASSIVKSLFSTKVRSTRIKVFFHTVKHGSDLFSCLVNSFSICGMLSGVGMVDTVCSSTVYAGKNGITLTDDQGLLPLHMAYMIHKKKVAQIHFDGCLDSSLIAKGAEELVRACIEQGSLLKLKIEEIVKGRTSM